MTKYKNLLSIAVICACTLLLINFGLRASMGFFMKPISEEFGYGREVFAFSLALQNLCWGLFQPIAGAVADKFGSVKTIVAGALFYALGLYITSIADSPLLLHTGAGLFIGMGIAGSGFGIVLPAMVRLVSLEKRGIALGLGTAAGSAGQLILVPVAQEFIQFYGWHTTLLILSLGALSMILFTPPFKGDATRATDSTSLQQQSLGEALKEASTHLHYWLLVAGFFVCGFQLAFVTVHMPSYISDKGFETSVAAISLALIGLFNIFGSLIVGPLSGRYSKKRLLAIIYAGRAIVLVLFLTFPISTFSIYAFSIASGFLWLATVPPTSGLVAQMFGVRYMGTLYGIVFLNHQLGSFAGVWLGGYFYDKVGSYDQVWWAAAIIAAITSIIHVFIDERPVARLRLQQSSSSF